MSAQDLDDIIFDLNQAGYPLKTEWFAPHMEFRFPHYGTIEHRGVVLELRQAIEPWHVLGEEPAGGGTVRYVDSSVERLQVFVNGMVDTRHVITCNGVRVPLHPTGTNGQFVAGVRYRAWQPAKLPAPDHRRSLAADVRHFRHLDWPLASAAAPIRLPSRRPQLRPVPSKRQRSRKPAIHAVLFDRTHAGGNAIAGNSGEQGDAVYVGFAAELIQTLLIL